MELENIIFKKANKIATITLNRPKFLNALCDQLIKEINYILDLLSKDDEVHVVILKGSNKAFAAGADINEMKDLINGINPSRDEPDDDTNNPKPKPSSVPKTGGSAAAPAN